MMFEGSGGPAPLELPTPCRASLRENGARFVFAAASAPLELPTPRRASLRENGARFVFAAASLSDPRRAATTG
jgi:hypothetical protein